MHRRGVHNVNRARPCRLALTFGTYAVLNVNAACANRRAVDELHPQPNLPLNASS